MITRPDAKAEVLRYLRIRERSGYKLPPQLDALIDECMIHTHETAEPRTVWKIFDLHLVQEDLLLASTLPLHGEDVRRFLAGCGKSAVFAATLGVKTDRLIRYWQHADVTRSLILDACATQLIEQVCNDLEQRIRDHCAEDNNGRLCNEPTTRFSPGYGDLPLNIQPNLLAMLDAERKIGLTCTENYIMLPRKSVTALLGIGSNTAALGCANCRMFQRCEYTSY